MGNNTVRAYIDNYQCPYAGLKYKAGYLGHRPYVFVMRVNQEGFKDYLLTGYFHGKIWEKFATNEVMDIPLAPSVMEQLDDTLKDIDSRVRSNLKEMLEWQDIAFANKAMLEATQERKDS